MTDNTPVRREPRSATRGRRRPRPHHRQASGEDAAPFGGRGVDAQSVALVAVFTALLVAAAVVPGIPVGGFGVPITLQTLAVMLTGLVLGPLRGGLAVLLYLLLGFVGLPVFSRGQSGLQVLSGPTAGYLVSFLVAAARRRARGAGGRPARQPVALGAPAARRLLRHDRRGRPRARRRGAHGQPQAAAVGRDQRRPALPARATWSRTSSPSSPRSPCTAPSRTCSRARAPARALA